MNTKSEQSTVGDLREALHNAVALWRGSCTDAPQLAWLESATAALSAPASATGGDAWEWDYGALIGGLDFPIWIAWDNGHVDYVEEGATTDFAGCIGWMHATPPEWPKVTK